MENSHHNKHLNLLQNNLRSSHQYVLLPHQAHVDPLQAVAVLLQVVVDPLQEAVVPHHLPNPNLMLQLLIQVQLENQKEEDVNLLHHQQKALEVKQISRQQPQNKQLLLTLGVVLLK